MPEHQHSTSKLKGKVRTRITLRKGEVIAVCRCWQSKNFPLCDGSHNENEDEKGPVMIRTDCNHDFLTHSEN